MYISNIIHFSNKSQEGMPLNIYLLDFHGTLVDSMRIFIEVMLRIPKQEGIPFNIIMIHHLVMSHIMPIIST